MSESLDVARYAYVFGHALSGKHSAHWSSYFATVILEKQEEIRLIRHEIKNKAFYMKELIERNDYEKLKEYISEEFSFPDTEREFITGNGILDGVLSFKQKEAEKKDIRFTVFSSPVTTEGIEDKDITALLFNLLDNAMHAQEHVTNGWINVEINDKGVFKLQDRELHR